ncbi:MAG: tRNA adenosine deaminase-associated protein [Nocardioidaceae bacterium]|jgi:putative tRNA adenosine deaminase-associated protein|nr:tRNA adenosine deaminase-associated protein [Nocardioidaceae bacterium]
MSEESVDLAVVAFREEGEWQVSELPKAVANDIDELIAALRPWRSDSGVLGLVAVDEDFFVLARVQGTHVRVLLSDVTAVTEWPIASGVADLLDVPDPDDDDDPQPAGDMDIVSDLGMSAMDLAVLCDDPELYPEEMLTNIATRLGFGAQFEDVVG